MDSIIQKIAGRPDFIARFGERAPEVAAAMLEGAIEATGIMSRIAERIDAGTQNEPVSLDEFMLWMGTIGGMLAPTEYTRQYTKAMNDEVAERENR